MCVCVGVYEAGWMLLHIKQAGSDTHNSSAGVSRSATLVIAYLMKSKGMKFADALAFLRSKRSKVRPNDNFVQQVSIELIHCGIEGKLWRSHNYC